LSGGGADVAIEALGTQERFENCPRCLRSGGTLSSLGVYSRKLQLPYDAFFAAGTGDYRIATTLCPVAKNACAVCTATVRSERVDLRPLFMHTFNLDLIVEAYDLFGARRDGLMKVAIKP
jgi:alcohol dehydrogenase